MGLHPSRPPMSCTSSRKFLFQILSPQTHNRAGAPTSTLLPWELKATWSVGEMGGTGRPSHRAPSEPKPNATCRDHLEAEGQRGFGPAAHIRFREVWKEVTRRRAGFSFCATPPPPPRFSRGGLSPSPASTDVHPAAGVPVPTAPGFLRARGAAATSRGPAGESPLCALWESTKLQSGSSVHLLVTSQNSFPAPISSREFCSLRQSPHQSVHIHRSCA